METVIPCRSIEEARNRAIQWLEIRGAIFGPDRAIQIGRLGALAGMETGVESTTGPHWRLRLDFDPGKQAHFNAEYGKGPLREKTAFTFPGGAGLIALLARARQPR